MFSRNQCHVKRRYFVIIYYNSQLFFTYKSSLHSWQQSVWRSLFFVLIHLLWYLSMLPLIFWGVNLTSLSFLSEEARVTGQEINFRVLFPICIVVFWVKFLQVLDHKIKIFSWPQKPILCYYRLSWQWMFMYFLFF